MEKKSEPLTLESFEEKAAKLQEVYDHNVQSLAKDFIAKMGKLYERLADEDKKVIVAKQQAKHAHDQETMIREQEKLIQIRNKGIVDRFGNSITH